MASFTKQSARRLVEAARFVEGQPRNRARSPRIPHQAFIAKYAVVSTDITARGAKLGKGFAILQKLTYDSSGDATPSDAGYAPVRVYSGSTTGIASGRLIQVKQIDGSWNVDVDYC